MGAAGGKLGLAPPLLTHSAFVKGLLGTWRLLILVSFGEFPKLNPEVTLIEDNDPYI